LRQEFSARPKLATPCGASGYSSWPSATVLDSTNTRNSTANRTNPNSTHSISDTLCDAVMKHEWIASVADDTGTRSKRYEQGGMPLSMQAANWPGPATRDHKGSSEGSIIRKDGKSRADMLDFAAEQFFHPPSSPDQTIATGAMSSTDGPNSNQPSVKRKLNPIFVEALMRWPTGLSGFERRETAWTLWWHTQHGFALALVSPREEPAQMTLL
jgi:hypothetical protein